MKLQKLLFMILPIWGLLTQSGYAETQNVKVSGSIDIMALNRQDFDLSGGNDQGSVNTGGSGLMGAANTPNVNHQSDGDSFFSTYTQLEVAATLTDNVSTVVNIVNQRDWNANDYQDGTTNTVTATTTNTGASEFDLALDLAYAEMKEIFYSPLTLTIGRQDLLFGRGFIVGWNPQDPQGTMQADEFTQIQSFDAIRATLDFNPWTVDFVYSKIDENAHNAEDDRDLYIVNVHYKFSEYNAVAEGYYMGEIDQATKHSAVDDETNTIHTFGGRFQFDPIEAMTFGAELAFQGGHYMATAGLNSRERSALGLDIFGEYRWDNSPWKPMLGLEYVHLSGEEDLSNGADSSYSAWTGNFRGPTYGMIRDWQGVYYVTADPNDQAAGTNQQHLSLYGTMQVMSDLSIKANYYHFWTDETAHAGITNLQGAQLDDEIGDELDLGLTYSYTEDLTFNFYANWFFPGAMYASANDTTASQYIGQVKVTF